MTAEPIREETIAECVARNARTLQAERDQKQALLEREWQEVNRREREQERAIRPRGRVAPKYQPAPMPSDAEIDAALAQIRRSKGHGQKET